MDDSPIGRLSPLLKHTLEQAYAQTQGELDDLVSALREDIEERDPSLHGYDDSPFWYAACETINAGSESPAHQRVSMLAAAAIYRLARMSDGQQFTMGGMQ